MQPCLLENNATDWLASFYTITGISMKNLAKANSHSHTKIRLMLDSGAYSAWAKGENIDLDEYIAYIKANRKHLHTYVNLDVIPGAPGQRATPTQVEESARLSYVNLQRMKKEGLNPIPVYHMGERWQWLERLIKDGHDYIGISPATEAATPEIVSWLDKVFTWITDEKGKALIKTHGFGVASFKVMKRYPWFTCDATSWALTAGFGSIFVPQHNSNTPDYKLPPIKVTISVAERIGNMPSDHISRFGPRMKRRVADWLQDEIGIDYDEACDSWRLRAKSIVFFIQKFQDAIGEVRFNRRQQRVFL